MIQRVLTLLLILSAQIFAYSYDDTIIQIEAKLFPKIILLEENMQDSKKSEIKIVILSSKLDENVASRFKSAIEKNYPNRLAGKKILVSVKTFSQAKKDTSDALIILKHSEDELTQIALWANKNHIISFAYDPYYLEYGVLASIYIGKTTKPFLNSTIMKEYNFNFNAFLLQLCKFTTTKESE